MLEYKICLDEYSYMDHSEENTDIKRLRNFLRLSNTVYKHSTTKHVRDIVLQSIQLASNYFEN